MRIYQPGAGGTDSHSEEVLPVGHYGVETYWVLEKVFADYGYARVRDGRLIHWNDWRFTMTLLNRITNSPKQCGGRPCVRGMRIRVVDILDLLSAGLSIEQILDELPDLEKEDVKACLEYAKTKIDDPDIAA